MTTSGQPEANKKHITAPWWVFDLTEDTESGLLIVNGGLGSGKTYGSVILFIERCFRNYQARFSWAVAPTHAKVRDILIPAFNDVLEPLYGLRENRDYEISVAAPARLIFKRFRHEVHFHTGTRPDRLVGTNIGHYLVTEVGFQKKEVFEKCETRARHKAAKTVQGILEGTFEQQEWHRELADFEGLSPERRAHAVRIWTEDNPHLAPGYYEKLCRLFGDDPAKLENYTRGTFRDCLTGTVYRNYRPDLHDLDDIDPDPHREIHLTLDFNANPLAWIAIQPVRFPNRETKWVAIHDAEEGHGQIDDAMIEFSDKFPPGLFRDTAISVYGDSSGHSESHKVKGTDYDWVRRHLRDLGYRNVTIRARHSNPRETESVGALNDLFLHDFHRICDRCKKYRESLKKTSWKDGVRKIEKKSGETHTHHSDAGKYWAWVASGKAPGESPIMGINF